MNYVYMVNVDFAKIYGLFINWHTYEVFKVSPNQSTYIYKTLYFKSQCTYCLIEEKSQWRKNLMATSFVCTYLVDLKHDSSIKIIISIWGK